MNLTDKGGAAFPRATEQTLSGFEGTTQGERAALAATDKGEE